MLKIQQLNTIAYVTWMRDCLHARCMVLMLIILQSVLLQTTVSKSIQTEYVSVFTMLQPYLRQLQTPFIDSADLWIFTVIKAGVHCISVSRYAKGGCCVPSGDVVILIL